MMRRTVPLALALPLALAALPGCTGTRGAAPSPEDGRQALATPEGVVRLPAASLAYIRVATVEQTSGSLDLRVPARVAFRDDAVSKIGAPAPGRVVAVAVRSGDPVRAGQAVLTIVSPEAASARTAVAAARTAQREARAAVDREERMVREGVGVEHERLEAGFRLAEAKAELERAEATAALLGDGRGAEVVVRAPLSGRVLDVRTSVGAAVEPGAEPLIEIGDPAAVWVVADVTDAELPLVREGAKASVTLNAAPTVFDATVVSVGAVVSDALRTAPVRLALDGRRVALRPGTFGRAVIKTAARQTTLPTEAVLIHGGRDPVVYVATGTDTFEKRTIVVGRPLDGRVQVLSGLAPGDRVVVQGALLLDGSAEQLL